MKRKRIFECGYCKYFSDVDIQYCGHEKKGKYGYVCTRVVGHMGKHVACVYTDRWEHRNHNLDSWE